MATEQGTWVAGLGRRRGYFTGGNLGYKIFGIWVEIQFGFLPIWVSTSGFWLTSVQGGIWVSEIFEQAAEQQVGRRPQMTTKGVFVIPLKAGTQCLPAKIRVQRKKRKWILGKNRLLIFFPGYKAVGKRWYEIGTHEVQEALNQVRRDICRADDPLGR